MPRPSILSGKVKKTLLLDRDAAQAITDLAAITGKDQGDIVELALYGNRQPVRNAMCFIGSAGEHPFASLMEIYQASPGTMSALVTEVYCDLAGEEADMRRNEFYAGEEYEQQEDLNGYIASRILPPVQDISGSAFRFLHDMARCGAFLSSDREASYRNFRSFVHEVKSFCADPAMYGSIDYLMRIMVVVLRDNLPPITDMETRRGMYRLAKDRGVELL